VSHHSTPTLVGGRHELLSAPSWQLLHAALGPRCLFVCCCGSFEGQILRIAVVPTPSDATLPTHHPQPQVGGLVTPPCTVISRPTCVRENRINNTTCCPRALLLGLTGRVLCRGVWPVWGVAWVSLTFFPLVTTSGASLLTLRPGVWVPWVDALICPLLLSCKHLYSMPPQGLVRVACVDVNGRVLGHKTRARAKFTKE
jgi:hypothetical protein